MLNLKPLPQDMVADIDDFLEQHRGRCISVYSEADKLRQLWEEHNIALEDVVCVFVDRCGFHGVAVSFDRHPDMDVLMEDQESRGEGRSTG